MNECLKMFSTIEKKGPAILAQKKKEKKKKGVRKRNTPGLQLWRDLSSNPRFCHLPRV